MSPEESAVKIGCTTTVGRCGAWKILCKYDYLHQKEAVPFHFTIRRQAEIIKGLCGLDSGKRKFP